MEKMIIIGAGLCGTLLAVRLAQLGYEVHLFEKRPDLRKLEMDAGRSINLALSDRGLKALSLVGLREEVESLLIPMYGRMIHPLDGEPWLSKYSGRSTDYINSVSRPGLNAMLLDATEEFDHLHVYFEHSCAKVNLDEGKVHLLNLKSNTEKIFEADMIFGADGAGSMVRRSYMGQSNSIRFDYSQDFLDHGYKELSIPASKNGQWRIEKNALHIWPRQDYMLIALPNLDGSFTVTLFLSFSDSPGFDFLDSEEKAVSFFKNTFPDALEHMPELGKEFFDNPTSTLGTIKCFPWVGKSNALLMGDAAHAIVPFYGQGMNCALEDVAVLDEQIVKYDGDWSQIAYAFQYLRKPHADAIAELALQNYNEMRDHVDDPNFVKKRKLEMKLEARYEDYYSKYSLVTFHENVDYSYAKKLGEKQDAFLLKYCKKIENVDQVNLGELYKSLKEL